MSRKVKRTRLQSRVEREQALIVLKVGPNPGYGRLAAAARELNTSPYRCYYWYRKSIDPTFHSFVHKGSESPLATFHSDEILMVHHEVLEFLKQSPEAKLEDVRYNSFYCCFVCLHWQFNATRNF